MSKKKIVICNDFYFAPGGRYYPKDGDYTGERFRDEFLIPALKNNDKVIVDLDGTRGLGSSFLEEAFGGLIRNGFSLQELLHKLELIPSKAGYDAKAWEYIKSAENNRNA